MDRRAGRRSEEDRAAGLCEEFALDLGRRSIIGGLMVAAAGVGLRPGRASAQTAASLMARARLNLAVFGREIPRQDVVGLADFARPSNEPRLHLVDMRSGQVSSVLVAHGRGSDPEHSGWVQRFSNEPGSYASSAGAFLTDALYAGAHGHSMRLIGLEASNSNALSRQIVVHAAPYVSPQMLRQFGKLGRSEGCFALDAHDLPTVLDRLGPGRLLVSAKLV
jgi:hypothetical protein